MRNTAIGTSKDRSLDMATHANILCGDPKRYADLKLGTGSRLALKVDAGTAVSIARLETKLPPNA